MFHKLHQKEQLAIIATHSNNLAIELKRVRLEAGISRNELATRSGISRPTISEIEDGNSQPTTGTLMRLIYALESSCSALFTLAETGLLNSDQDASIDVSELDEDLEKALMKLRRKSTTNPDLRSTVIDIAKLQTVYPKP